MTSSTRHQDGPRRSAKRSNRFESSSLPPVLFHLPNLNADADAQAEEVDETPDMAAAEEPDTDRIFETEQAAAVVFDSAESSKPAGPSILEQLGTHTIVFGLLALVVTAALLYGQKNPLFDSLESAQAETSEVNADDAELIEEHAAILEPLVADDLEVANDVIVVAEEEQTPPPPVQPIAAPEISIAQTEPPTPAEPAPVQSEPVMVALAPKTATATKSPNAAMVEEEQIVLEPLPRATPENVASETEVPVTIETIQENGPGPQIVDAEPLLESKPNVESVVDLNSQPNSPDMVLLDEQAPKAESLNPPTLKSTIEPPAFADNATTYTQTVIDDSDSAAMIEPIIENSPAEVADVVDPSPQVAASDEANVIPQLEMPQADAIESSPEGQSKLLTETNLETDLDALAAQVDELQKIQPTKSPSPTEPTVQPASTRTASTGHMAQDLITFPGEPTANTMTDVSEGASEIENYFTRTPLGIEDWSKYFPQQ